MKEISALKMKVNKNEMNAITDAVSEVLKSGIKWTNSNYCRLCERKISEIWKIPYCAMTSSGSSAIESVLISLNIEESCIFVPVLTAPATIYSCLNAKSDIVLVDANREDYSLDLYDLENKIKKYYVGRYKVKGAIIVVHIGGIITPNIEKLKKLATKYNLYLIEDCAHAHGSELKGLMAGSWGDAATYSFFLTKTISSGEGGAVLSYNRSIIEDIRKIINYGKDEQGKHVFKGSSWRMNEFTAAVLINRLMSYNHSIRENQAKLYSKLLCDSICFNVFKVPNNSKSGYYKFIVKVPEYFNYMDFLYYMKEKGISLPAKVFNTLTIEEPYLSKQKSILNKCDEFKNAKSIINTHICLPIYESLTEEDIHYICICMKEYENMYNHNSAKNLS